MRFKISKTRIQEIAGALTNAMFEAGLEAYYIVTPGLTNMPPYISVGSDLLPPLDDWLPLIASLPVYVVGTRRRGPAVENFGKGMVIYGVGNVVTVTTGRVLRNQLGSFSLPRMVYRPSGVTPMAYTGAGKYTLAGGS